VSAAPGGGAPSGEAADTAAVVDLAMEAGRMIHRFGGTAGAVERVVTLAARRHGLEAEVFASPTMLQAAFGPRGDQRLAIARTAPGAPDLGGRARAEEILARHFAGTAAIAETRAELARLRDAPRGLPAPWMLLAGATASAAAARVFGGGLEEIAASGFIGLLVGALAWAAERARWIDRLFPCVAALVASAAAAEWARRRPGFAAPTAVVSALIVLLPGLSLTVAVAELAARHLASGVARLAHAAMTLLLMAFGVALGDRLVAAPSTAANAAPRALPGWTEWFAVAVAPLAFAGLLRAAPRDWVTVVVGGVLGFSLGRFGAEAAGAELGAFFGAFGVAVIANAWSRLADRSASLIMTPGFLMLVPGAVGLRSLTSFVRREVIEGVGGVFNVVLIAVAIVAGLFLAQQLVPPRFVELPEDEPR